MMSFILYKIPYLHNHRPFQAALKRSIPSLIKSYPAIPPSPVPQASDGDSHPMVALT
jgi:hypothetical protein